MLPTLRNLLTFLPAARDADVNEALIIAHGNRLQRIISFGQVSPEGFWYDQIDAEWVMLLTGRARLLIAGEADERFLGLGDAVYLPAHCRHRVGWTDTEHPTVWLALFIDGQLGPIVSDPMTEGHALGEDGGPASRWSPSWVPEVSEEPTRKIRRRKQHFKTAA